MIQACILDNSQIQLLTPRALCAYPGQANKGEQQINYFHSAFTRFLQAHESVDESVGKSSAKAHFHY